MTNWTVKGYHCSMENMESMMVNNEALSNEEELVVLKGVEAHVAIAEYEKAFHPMIARGQMAQLSEIYGEKWKELIAEYDTAREPLSSESREKVHLALNKALEEKGISLESSLNK